MREDFITVELKDNLLYKFENLTFSYFKIYACNNRKYLQKKHTERIFHKDELSLSIDIFY